MSKHIVDALACLLCLACAAGAPRPAAVTASPVPEAWLACETTADCVLVVTTCCDHCNGGTAVSVHRTWEQQAKNLRPKCHVQPCMEPGTMRTCQALSICENGKCVVRREP